MGFTNDGSSWEIALYDGTTTTHITDDAIYDINPKISGSNVVWQTFDGNDTELALYDGTTTIQLTNNGYEDVEYTIDGNTIVWEGWVGGIPQIFMAVPTFYSINNASAQIEYKWNGDQGKGRDGLPPGQTPFKGTLALTAFLVDGDSDCGTLIWEYDPIDLSVLNIVEDTVRLYWYDESTSTWILAGEASNNTQNGDGEFVLGAPTDVLGDWGLDIPNNYAWANIDHASEYALVGQQIPEPTTIALLAIGGIGLIRRKRKQ